MSDFKKIILIITDHIQIHDAKTYVRHLSPYIFLIFLVYFHESENTS